MWSGLLSGLLDIEDLPLVGVPPNLQPRRDARLGGRLSRVDYRAPRLVHLDRVLRLAARAAGSGRAREGLVSFELEQRSVGSHPGVKVCLPDPTVEGAVAVRDEVGGAVTLDQYHGLIAQPERPAQLEAIPKAREAADADAARTSQ